MSTAAYFGTATAPVAPRPRNSVLDLTKIESAGFRPVDADETLVNYIRRETAETDPALPERELQMLDPA